jgi:hypothetical protein
MMLLSESTAWPLIRRQALWWPLDMGLTSSKGEDELSVIAYYTGVHQSCGWPNPIKDSVDCPQG